MPNHLIEYTLQSSDRREVRNEIITLFLHEAPGNGKGELCSKYEYTVDRYDDYSIVIKRPANLNKGFDFTVHINGMWFKENRRLSNPRHKNIIDTLLQVKQNNMGLYCYVNREINNIFTDNTCNFDKIKSISFVDYEGIERPIGIILLAIKWLFIEQDMTYWNWSGRHMLYSRLQEYGLV